MQVNISDIRRSLNKAWLKSRPVRSQIETFKDNIVKLLNNIDGSESEEFHKNLLSDFLKNTYYSPGHFINTRGRADLVIHTGKDSSSPVGVLFELKKPGNHNEMPAKDNISSKAFSELVLYYLRERANQKNVSLRHLIITDIYDWFIFSSNDFEKIFFNNKSFSKSFEDFENNRLAGSTTDFFYKNIVEPFVNGSDAKIDVTHFDLKEFEEVIRNTDRPDDRKLIALHKIFSPEHLLNLSFTNDSNTLDKSFYSELLHIIGIEETKEGGKKVIGRKREEKRDRGSMIENAINILRHEDCLAGLNRRSDYGTSEDEQLYNVALELIITWINRILFLKLLESQLVRYNGGDRSFRFLHNEFIPDYDELNRLFFQVLAVKEDERGAKVSGKYARIPFLNSSLFEPSHLEHRTIRISSLEDNLTIPVTGSTVLRTSSGKKAAGEMNTLRYLFEFLDAYDFSGEGSEDIQEENKTLINASVLGLIFEKINGYKDGSFFTPGFITMYMCHETITRAVVQKFNDAKGWKCETISDVYNNIKDIKEANTIINSLKICDPAVGSGHFLVSALNEIIAIKSELGILCDSEGKRLKDHIVEVINDELVVTGPDGEFFEYNPKSRESQRVQETLFREKETIIENCLFGVDINPNSVKICRLRLWIELLKNAFYRQQVISNRHPTPLTPRGAQPATGRQQPPSHTPNPQGGPTGNQQLETLPNIDINIKCGNSLISRYPLDADIKSALKSAKWNVDNYREAIMTYRNAPSKEVKRNMEELIEKIKGQFETEVARNDKRLQKLNKLKGELDTLTGQGVLFDKSKKEKDEWNKKVKKATDEMQKLESEIAGIKSNKIYENAFEWRFEFPEVLNGDGDFIGFDVVIGNPPYIYRSAEINPYKDYFKENYCNNTGNYDLYKYFIERSLEIISPQGLCSLITNSSYLVQSSFFKTRKFLLENSTIIILASLGPNVFEEATVDTAIYIIEKNKTFNQQIKIVNSIPHNDPTGNNEEYFIKQNRFKKNEGFIFDINLKDEGHRIVNKLFSTFPTIESQFDFGVGINTGYIKSVLVSENKIDESYHPMVSGTGISRYGTVKSNSFIMYDKQFVNSKGNMGRTLPDEKFFIEDKILIVRTRNISLKQRIIATIDSQKKYNLNRLSNIIAKGNSSIFGLLGVLNSKLFNWIFSTHFFDYEIKPIYLRNSPLADVNNPQLIKIVKEIFEKRKVDPSADTTSLEAEIDRLVYDLYGLTDEERQIVEDS